MDEREKLESMGKKVSEGVYSIDIENNNKCERNPKNDGVKLSVDDVRKGYDAVKGHLI
ncbi:MAG: hypothetical protein HPY53_02525 [Brevinematales bacterium]|nr:hypothetical protein [Brevinematales bacterium]